MHPRSRLALITVTALALTLLPAASALATNGMYLTGYGAEVVGRAGANLAVSDRTLAINFNPAGISQLQGRHYTANLSLLVPSLTTENGINGPVDSQDQYFPLPAFAWVRGDGDSPWSFGLGFVAQGGMGVDFRDVRTPFGGTDDVFTEVRFLTAVPTVAYALSDDMAVGAALNVGYADASFSLYPNSSFFNTAQPEASFFGVDLERAGGLQTNLRLGWWWRLHPRVTMGAIYQTETESDFEDGDMVVDFTAHPFLGRKVGYTADIDGFTFAAQAGVGVAFRASDRLIVAADLKRYFWDDAIDTITVTATQPEVNGAPESVQLPFVFNWEDQWVVAVGGDYRASDRLTLRAGFNYGENPVPEDTLTPLFPATVERHVAVGFSYLVRNTTWHAAVVRAFENDVTNPNPNPQVNPFGPGSRVEHSQWTLSIGAGWALDLKH